MAAPPPPVLGEVRDAERRLRGRVHRTPLLTCAGLDRMAGRRLLFKCELFQRTGSFKIRGALNALRSLVEEGERSGRELPRAVVTHSSGNHGQALACAAQAEGIPAYIVVPRTAPQCKQDAIRAYGATLVPCEPSDKALRPDVKVFAAEPCNVDDCYQSKVRGELTPNLHPRDTIADAVKTSIGPNTWPIIRDLVDDVLTVSEEEIKRATWLVWERMKLLIEPTAGVGLAAVLSEQFQAVPRDVQNICIVLCGGNVDLRSLTWLTDLSGKAE
ncbi:serine racemase isoform X3 [Corvus moneduloides]|uniref:serine racemase isoform X3 n=1 Tax=Corvus moneduloides TaxID=1196302 RepID=UPI00136284D1|nr:serine racemase isoform X3 [Corvus moneduloides]